VLPFSTAEEALRGTRNRWIEVLCKFEDDQTGSRSKDPGLGESPGILLAEQGGKVKCRAAAEKKRNQLAAQ
jgi:hypothetical protein